MKIFTSSRRNDTGTQGITQSDACQEYWNGFMHHSEDLPNISLRTICENLYMFKEIAVFCLLWLLIPVKLNLFDNSSDEFLNLLLQLI